MMLGFSTASWYYELNLESDSKPPRGVPVISEAAKAIFPEILKGWGARLNFNLSSPLSRMHVAPGTFRTRVRDEKLRSDFFLAIFPFSLPTRFMLRNLWVECTVTSLSWVLWRREVSS